RIWGSANSPNASGSVSTRSGTTSAADCWLRISDCPPATACTGRRGNSVDSSHIEPRQDAAAPSTAELIDPVCAMKVSHSSTHVAEFEGYQYVFCSAGCRTKFLADPAKYISGGKHSTSAQSGAPCCAHKLETAPLAPQASSHEHVAHSHEDRSHARP